MLVVARFGTNDKHVSYTVTLQLFANMATSFSRSYANPRLFVHLVIVHLPFSAFWSNICPVVKNAAVSYFSISPCTLSTKVFNPRYSLISVRDQNPIGYLTLEAVKRDSVGYAFMT